MTGRLLLVFLIAILSATGTAWCKISLSAVQAWAKIMGDKLWDLGQICGFSELDRKSGQSYFYTMQFKVEIKNDRALVQEIATSIHNMTQLKLSAIRRIAKNAETLALNGNQGNENYTFYGNKAYDPDGVPLDKVQYLNCTPNKHFYGENVNIGFSSVHVPINIYHRAPDVLKVIEWTEDLEAIFKSNYEQDPSLSWQYFGSSLGIMRQYPGVLWNDSQVDTFDCRMRLWYIDASLSPKDVIILVDNSGSMTGTNKETARHLVNNILETLGSNDFVNVLKFSNTTDPIIKCFRNISLVQATLGNVRELKLAMKTLKAEKVADFRLALTKAFELFNMSLEKNLGASCNRAIMVITDGMPDIYKDIFDEYNWKADMRARMFTFRIGDEETGAREMQWIACNNNGYFVSLSKQAEVREKVLRYMPVMSRPFVLLGERPVSWTPIYANLADPQLTDLLWVQHQNKEQTNVTRSCYFPKKFPSRTYRATGQVFKNCSEELEITREQDPAQNTLVYHYVISVSMPVLDVGENKTKTAQIVGVAGTDIPIEDIKKLLLSHKVGVNGYVFMITNNGHLLIHPDWRPEFLGILKPSYNSVDLTEVEHVDDDSIIIGQSDPGVIEMRKAMIDQEYGKKNLLLKYHFDHMKRISTVRQQYTHTGIKDTPFSIGLALPYPYGLHIAHPLEDKLKMLTTRKPTRNYKDVIKQVRDFSEDGNWTVHPDWVYCKYHYDTAHEFSSSEEELRHFLELLDTGRGFQCSPVRHLIPPEQINSAPYPKLKMDSCYCDMELLNSLIHDATETRFWSKRNIIMKQDKFIKEFGVTVVFLATHSGLTRWQPFQDNTETSAFKERHTQTIDEVWYQRAVDLQDKSGTFVYSVPFSVGQGNNSNALVTASYAVFTEDKKVPLAVAGYQFEHLKLFSEFYSITSKCTDCTSCSSDELACYILDNNGFIVVSEEISETGKFFGEVEGNAMKMLIQEKVFKIVHIVDYQAICLHEDESTSHASFLITPVQHLLHILEWLIGTTVWLLAEISLWHGSLTDAAKVKPTQLPKEDAKINRTHLEPCIKELDLYQLQNISYMNTKVISSGSCSQYTVVQKLSHSNLILVVVDVLCSDDSWTNVRIKMEVKDSNIFCMKATRNELTRKRPKTCIGRDNKAENLQEPHIAECGCDSQFEVDIFLMLICWCVGVLSSTEH